MEGSQELFLVNSKLDRGGRISFPFFGALEVYGGRVLLPYPTRHNIRTKGHLSIFLSIKHSQLLKTILALIASM